MKTVLKSLVAAGAFVSMSAHAGLILQDQLTGGVQVNFYEPVGQSFRAEDAHVKFAFNYRAVNPDWPVDTLPAPACRRWPRWHYAVEYRVCDYTGI